MSASVARDKRRSRLKKQQRQEEDDDEASKTQESFVTAPPPPNKGKNITSGISMLFRRTESSSKEKKRQQQQRVSPIAANNPAQPSDSMSVCSDSRSVQSSNSRVFYSNNDDDSDEDSYESRISQKSGGSVGGDDDEEKELKRYRGFSTSIRHLFLDEQLVCASMGCFGLVLSQRTEYLLNIRNQQRGVHHARGTKKKANRAPSRIVAYAFILMLLLLASTFCIWGFGQQQQQVNDGEANNDQGNNGYNEDENNNYEEYGQDRLLLQQQSRPNNKHSFAGIYKVRDYQEHLWEPICTLVKTEWYRPPNDDSRVLEEDGYYNEEGGDDDDDAAASVVYYEDEQDQQPLDVGGVVRMAILFVFFAVLGIVGRRRRMRTRYSLVRARAQEDHLIYASSTRMSSKGDREDQYQGACSHTLCGCYPVDPPYIVDDDEDSTSSLGTPVTRRKKRKYMDCVARSFQCLLGMVCGKMCKCWCQCLSICALAQEAREIRLLLPPRLQRIDYITHQPFHEYQKDVNDLRKGWLGKQRPKSGIMPHIYAISTLSRYILGVFLFCVLTVVFTLLFNPRASFSWNDCIVLVATFCQSFLVLYVVFWVFHKSDLSLDAVIKFYAAGFLIATPAAMIFEFLLTNMALMVVYTIYGIVEAIRGQPFSDWVEANYQILWIVAELVNAYVVAAVTEELCKYYTFRTVEHPDLIFLTGLDRKHHERSAGDGGVASYSFSGHQVSDFNQRVNSFRSESEYSRSSRQSRKKLEERMIEKRTTQEEYEEDDNDVRTFRQKAAALTTGMISVAVGLACAENFLYVFLVGTAEGVVEEWIVLFFRSIFPVHALAAAMQSINMIRKFVECTDDNSHNIGVGRIIIPAVLLHGTFDAVLMVLNAHVEYTMEQSKNGEGEMYNGVALNAIAWVSTVAIMLLGILWYYRENRAQRVRLILLEEREKARHSKAQDPYEPQHVSRIPSPVDIEMV